MSSQGENHCFKPMLLKLDCTLKPSGAGLTHTQTHTHVHAPSGFTPKDSDLIDLESLGIRVFSKVCQMILKYSQG